MIKNTNFYEVKGTKFGKKKTIQIEAYSLENAEIEAYGQLDTIITVKKTGSHRSIFNRGMNIEERNIFLNTLATLSAALNMDVALKEMINHFKGPIKNACSLLFKKIESGKMPDEAIEEIGDPHFPSTVVAMIKAGMSAGNMSNAFREAAEFEEEMLRIKKESGNNMYFSIAGFIFAAFVILVSRYWFVPYMKSGDMKTLMEAVDFGFTDLLTDWTTYSMLFMVFLFMFLIFLSSIGKRVFPLLADSIILKIPLYKHLVLAKKNYITVYQLGKLLEKGVPVRNALLRTVENMERGRMKRDFENALENLSTGKIWSDALTSFSPMDKSAIRASNDQFKIARTLKELAIQYKINYKKIVTSVNIALFFISIVYLSIAILILFLYTTLPVFEMIKGSGFQ